MPKFLEKKLKAEYGKDSDIPYKVMNSMGVMHGNKITKKGEKMEKKHDAKNKALKNMKTKWTNGHKAGSISYKGK